MLTDSVNIEHMKNAIVDRKLKFWKIYKNQTRPIGINDWL